MEDTPPPPPPSLSQWGATPVVLTIKYSNIMEPLQFLDTMTIEQFKAKMLVDVIKVKRNPKNNRLFFSYGTKVGAVAVKGVPTHPMISHVKGEPTPLNPSGEFYLLHEEGQGGAPVVATF